MKVNNDTVYLVTSQKGVYLFTSKDQAQRTQIALLDSGLWVNKEIFTYLPGELEETHTHGERIKWVNKATQRRK